MEEHEGGHEDVTLADRLMDAQEARKAGEAARDVSDAAGEASDVAFGAKLAARKMTLLKLMEGLPDMEQGMDENAGTGSPDLGQGWPPTGFDGPVRPLGTRYRSQQSPHNSRVTFKAACCPIGVAAQCSMRAI